jgi:peptide/nickel transport system substrate-binding protein
MNRDYDEFFGDIAVRQAMAHAIDREGLVEAIFFGDAIATYGPFPPTDRNYEPAVEELNQFDLDTANQLLDDAGWTLGSDGIREKEGTKLAFEFAVSSESLNVAVGTAVSGMLREIGVDAQVTQYDLAVLFERQSGAGRDASPMSVFFWLWPIPLDVLTLFSSEATVPVPNFSHAITPALDEAIAAWQASATEEEAQAAASAFQLAWAEELPYISLATQNAVFVKRNSVHGWLPTLWNLYPYYNDVWIEP